jgi:hypothetical protein
VKGVLAGICGLLLASCAGIYGPKGNDTGGVIPWSVENEQHMMLIAQGNCSTYGKLAVVTTIHRVYGDFITYECRFGPPLQRSVGPARAYTEGPPPARMARASRTRNASPATTDPMMMR